ncbi:hypothetical protein KDL45_10210, partial [bacterium]|nr:hypothetical protein [bacterium]
EVSFIDYVYIRKELEDGRDIIVYSNDLRLKAMDGILVELRQHEILDLRFPEGSQGTVIRQWIGVGGYYIPNDSMRDVLERFQNISE